MTKDLIMRLLCLYRVKFITFRTIARFQVFDLLACLLRILALREVKESKLLLAFGQCIMKLLGSNIIFETETNFENLNERKKMKHVC